MMISKENVKRFLPSISEEDAAVLAKALRVIAKESPVHSQDGIMSVFFEVKPWTKSTRS